MLRACIDLLSQFGIISSLFTPLQLQCQHTSLHSRLSEELLQNLSAERCRIAMSQLNKHAIRVNLPPAEQLVNYQAQLQVATKHSAARLQEMYKKLDEEPRQQVSTMKEQLVNLAKDNGKVATMAIIQVILCP
jgi:arsenate reductase-like glutaredoxin family protein